MSSHILNVDLLNLITPLINAYQGCQAACDLSEDIMMLLSQLRQFQKQAGFLNTIEHPSISRAVLNDRQSWLEEARLLVAEILGFDIPEQPSGIIQVHQLSEEQQVKFKCRMTPKSLISNLANAGQNKQFVKRLKEHLDKYKDLECYSIE